MAPVMLRSARDSVTLRRDRAPLRRFRRLPPRDVRLLCDERPDRLLVTEVASESDADEELELDVDESLESPKKARSRPMVRAYAPSELEEELLLPLEELGEELLEEELLLLLLELTAELRLPRREDLTRRPLPVLPAERLLLPTAPSLGVLEPTRSLLRVRVLARVSCTYSSSDR